MNSYPVSQTGNSVPDAHNTLGADFHTRVALADRAHRYESAVRERGTCVTAHAEAIDKLATAERNESQWRAERVAMSNRVTELAASIATADAAIRANLPPAGAPVAAPIVHTASSTGLTFSEAIANHVTPADAIARAYGFADAREHMKARLLKSLDEPVRVAIEGDVAALTQALDLALGGNEDEAIAVANALVAKAKKEPKK